MLGFQFLWPGKCCACMQRVIACEIVVVFDACSLELVQVVQARIETHHQLMCSQMWLQLLLDIITHVHSQYQVV